MRILAVIVATAYVSTTAFAQIKPTPTPECDPQLLVTRVREGKPLDALAQSERCAAYYAADTTIWRIVGGYYHYINAQLQAMLGNFAYANVERAKADRYEYGVLADVRGLSAATEGFILERQGDTARARRAYYRGSKEGYAMGRLALLALQEKDDHTARLWARQGVAVGDPASFVVLAALAELEGDRTTALGYYFAAKERMDSARHNFLPIYFVESSRITRALTSWGEAERTRGARIVVVNGRRQFFDAQGNRVGEERWPSVLFSSEVEARQREYNAWAARTLAGRPRGIVVGPQYPRNFAPYELLLRPNRSEDLATSATVEIRVPSRIEPTGVLDISTIAIGFYKLAVEWAQLCQDAGVPAREIEATVDASAMEGTTSAAFRAAVKYQLGETLTSLERLYGFLRGVRMRTSGGAIYDAAQEGASYTTFLAQLRSRVLSDDPNSLATLPAALLENPPDFITAHVPAEQLSSEFIAALASRGREVRAGLVAARALMRLLSR